jgi:hypothetical protein
VFNDRVFLPNAKARKLLSEYASSGLSSQDISDMIELLNEYSPSAATIISSVMSDQETSSLQNLNQMCIDVQRIGKV